MDDQYRQRRLWAWINVVLLHQKYVTSKILWSKCLRWLLSLRYVSLKKSFVENRFGFFHTMICYIFIIKVINNCQCATISLVATQKKRLRTLFHFHLSEMKKRQLSSLYTFTMSVYTSFIHCFKFVFISRLCLSFMLKHNRAPKQKET